MKKSNILLVEDDSTIRSVYKMILEGEGYQVYTADNGQDGLRIALDTPVDLILLDLMMPKMSGDEMLRQLRKNEQESKTKVILLTNVGKSEVPEDIQNLEISSIQVKVDLSPDQLLKLIDKTLAD